MVARQYDTRMYPPSSQRPLAERVRSFDWSRTALGPMSRWPVELRVAVDMVIANPFPQTLLWGPEFLVCAYNDAYLPLLGEKECLGRSFLDVWHEVRPEIEPALLAARDGESSEVQDAEFTLMRNGFPEAAYFDYAFSPITNAAGDVFAVLNTAVDRTAAAHAAHRLQESEERFRALVNASSDVVYQMSPDWSDMRELDGRGLPTPSKSPREAWMRKFVDKLDRETVRTAVQRAIESRSTFELEHRIRRADGSLGWTHSRAIPRFDQKGELVEWFGAATDVTLRRRAEEALREANERLSESDRRKDEFLATLAHELRNPLAPIQSGIDLLNLTADHLEELQPVLPIMVRQMARLRRLVDDLLDVSRITQGKITLSTAQVNLSALVSSVLGTMLPQPHRNIYLAVPDEPLMLVADEVRLAQVIGNILDNAVKYTEKASGNIWVSIGIEGADAVVRVRDDGIGIAPELLEIIFNAFEQADPAQGLGLGLALVRQLVELHGGRVEARSEGLGKGSEFRVYLPMRGPGAATDPAPP